MKLRSMSFSGAALLALGAIVAAPTAAHASAGGCAVGAGVGTCIEINGSGFHVNWMRASTDNKSSNVLDLQTCIHGPNGKTVVCTAFANIEPGRSTAFANAPGNRNYPGGSYCARTWLATSSGHQLINEHCETIHG